MNPPNSQPLAQSQALSRTRKHATATITVQNSEATPFGQSAGPQLTEIRITETFAGDIDAESTLRALQIQREDHSAKLISLQRVNGKLDGREGTFVLQGSETVENGKIKGTWSVVPGSGTGDLAKLCGEGGFEGEFGKASKGARDYWFE
jgi:hypothetical protein